MSRTLDAVLAIALTFAAAVPGAAQPSSRSGSAGCDDGWNDSRRASSCEVREETIPGVNPLDVDAGQNGGIHIRGWDRPDVLVRATIRASADTSADARRIAAGVRIETGGGRIASMRKCGRRCCCGISRKN